MSAEKAELVAFTPQSRTFDGQLEYPGYYGATYVTPSDAWLLEQSNNVVGRLDRAQPWALQAFWNIGATGASSCFNTYMQPNAVVPGPGTKAYVLRYGCNSIAVIDTTGAVFARPPSGEIDLSAEAPSDGNAFLRMTAGVYVPGRQRLYVLLANVGNSTSCQGTCLMCTGVHPSIVAIDTSTDALVPMKARSPNLGVALNGYNPADMVYDPDADRLLVLHAGCNQLDDGGDSAPLTGNGVEEVSLADGTAKTLLDFAPLGTRAAPLPPQGGLFRHLYYIDPHHAILDRGQAYTWDPSTTTLGPPIPNSSFPFVYDGAGGLLGVELRAGWQVVQVRVPDGMVTTLGLLPYSNDFSSLIGLQLWGAPPSGGP
jgi:hypothetical protein